MNCSIDLVDKPLIVIIDDHQVILERFGSFFREEHYFEVVTAATQEEAITCIEEITRPAVIILDRFMRNQQGDLVLGEDILQILLQRAKHPIVSIFHSIDDSTSAQLNALRKGADWYLPKGCDIDLLVAYVWKAVELIHRLTEPNKDPLSGALNRRGMFDRVIREMSHVERLGTTTACMFFDVDKLKSINDIHGHSIGDKVIVSVVNSLLNHLRPTDVVCRWGGDEVIVFLFDLQEEDITKLAQDYCRNIIEKVIFLDDKEHKKGSLSASVSVGVSILKPEQVVAKIKSLAKDSDKTKAFMNLLNSVIEVADKQMYVEKQKNKR